MYGHILILKIDLHLSEYVFKFKIHPIFITQLFVYKINRFNEMRIIINKEYVHTRLEILFMKF